MRVFLSQDWFHMAERNCIHPFGSGDSEKGLGTQAREASFPMLSNFHPVFCKCGRNRQKPSVLRISSWKPCEETTSSRFCMARGKPARAKRMLRCLNYAGSKGIHCRPGLREHPPEYRPPFEQSPNFIRDHQHQPGAVGPLQILHTDDSSDCLIRPSRMQCWDGGGPEPTLS